MNPEGTADASEAGEWLAEHGDVLYAYALARLRRPDLAKDVVQETLLSAMKADFDGRASRRTWLVSILRRRIVDLLRRTDDGRAEQALDDAVRRIFDERGKWATPRSEEHTSELRHSGESRMPSSA